jgi:uncharacterized membrane protein
MEIEVDSILAGRILGGTVIGVGLIYSILAAVGDDVFERNAFEIFLGAFVVPLGVGFLIIVMTEVLKVLGQSKPQA